MRRDAKKKKYVRADANDKKKIKTESGVWIPASYKSNRYAKWKERSKLAQMQVCYAHSGGYVLWSVQTPKVPNNSYVVLFSI